jgi:hypothetical protein
VRVWDVSQARLLCVVGTGRAVSEALPSCARRPILAEIYLRHACSCHEIEDGNAWTAAPTHLLPRGGGAPAGFRPRHRRRAGSCRALRLSAGGATGAQGVDRSEPGVSILYAVHLD